MAKFSAVNGGRTATSTENLAGGEAFKQSPELQLAQMLYTSFISDKFYRSGDDELKQLQALCGKVDPLFAAQAAVYARHIFGMRSASHVVAAQIGKLMVGKNGDRTWLKDFYNIVVRRPDDMREIVALTFGGPRATDKGSGHSIPKAMQKGFRLAFPRFDEYQLGAYRGEGGGVKLVDVARLCHARPEGENAAALGKLIEGTLRSQKQDAKLTQAGQAAETEEQKAQLKRDVWVEQLPRMGYNAVVMNARGILDAAPELAGKLCERIEDAVAVRSSLILPLQLWKAYLALEEKPGKEGRMVMASLSKAIDLACANLPALDGETLVVLDTSGSMTSEYAPEGPFKGHSAIAIGSVFAAILCKALNADMLHFSNDAAYLNYNPADSTLSLAGNFRSRAYGGGTNFHAIFTTANRHYDRIVILSDMQGWMGYTAPTASFDAYRKRFGDKPVRIYSFDLHGYGTSMFPEAHVAAVAGLNFAVFELFAMCEKNPQAIIDEIKSVQFTMQWVREHGKQQQRAG